ncbi:hypothetical protein Purlil1_8914 [Purpureocillium lilacinum]|uniref:Uncharacterized protein n=1 Tax=Purpureocillium lilacinum TaxID=33203 RepID=A0ABR0BS16_PURLI|nr:hypothetical protein Purlil1_8914 [Purpureocillium lilacinum]
MDSCAGHPGETEAAGATEYHGPYHRRCARLAGAKSRSCMWLRGCVATSVARCLSVQLGRVAYQETRSRRWKPDLSSGTMRVAAATTDWEKRRSSRSRPPGSGSTLPPFRRRRDPDKDGSRARSTCLGDVHSMPPVARSSPSEENLRGIVPSLMRGDTSRTAGLTRAHAWGCDLQDWAERERVGGMHRWMARRERGACVSTIARLPGANAV